MKAYDAVGTALAELGVTALFGVLGDGNLRFGIAAERNGIRYVSARHEAGAVAMADAYARVSGAVGVATVTTGPGVTNAMTALGEAVRSRTPVVVLAGAVGSAMQDYPQLVDQETLVKTLGVGLVRFRGSRYLATDVVTAFRRALSERRPVMISVPTDTQEEEVGALPDLSPIRLAARCVPEAEAVADVAAIVRRLPRVVILAGWGAHLAGAGTALRRLAHLTDAVLMTTALTKGMFAGERAYAGVSGGFASAKAREIAEQADLVLAFGTTLSRWTMRGGEMFPHASVVQIDIAPESFESYVGGVVTVLGDAKLTAHALADLLVDSPHSGSFASEIPDAMFAEARAGDPFIDQSTDETIDPRALTVHLRETLPASAVVVQDSGAFVGFPGSYYEPSEPGGYLFVQGFQTMGLGLAQAVGVALARPDAIPTTMIGDGGLLMSLGELETLVRLGHPNLVVVFNDSAYGAEVHIGGHHGLDTEIVRFPEVDFAEVARALGGQAHTVRTRADLDILSNWIEDPRGLLLLDCKTDARIASPFLAEVFAPAPDHPRARSVSSADDSVENDRDPA